MEKQGNKEFKIEEFRELLAIPKSYSKDAINQRVLKPIQKELGKCFDNFKIKPIKNVQKVIQSLPINSHGFQKRQMNGLRDNLNQIQTNLRNQNRLNLWNWMRNSIHRPKKRALKKFNRKCWNYKEN